MSVTFTSHVKEALSAEQAARNKALEIIGGKLVQTGVMRGTCLIFDGKSGNWKPAAVTLDNKACLFYEKE